MRNLLLLFRKFGSLILFVFLELIALFLIVSFNNKQRDIFLYSSNLFSGQIMDRYDAGVDYFKLRNINDSIVRENAKLLGILYNNENKTLPEFNGDSIINKYQIIPAKIINKTINLRNNRFTLNKGLKDSIRADMGVISNDGIIGVINKVNNSYSSVMPIINTRFQVSAKIKRKNYFGDLIWEPYDERYLQLQHIPKHAGVALGDTVITSGYSTVFPPEIPIGVIENIQLPSGSNYFDIRVKLFNLLANMEYVYVVNNRLKPVQNEIEKVE